MERTNRLASIACAALWAASSLAAPVAPPVVPVEQLLPEDTCLVVDARLGNQLRATHLWKLWSDPALAGLRERVMADPKAKDLFDVLEHGEGRVTLAVFAPLIEYEDRRSAGEADLAAPAEQCMLLIADEGIVGKGWSAKLDQAITELRKNPQYRERRDRGFTVHAITVPAEDGKLFPKGTPLPLALARGNGKVVIGLEKDVSAFLSRLESGGGDRPLASSKPFLKSWEALGEGEGVRIWADLSCLWRTKHLRYQGSQEKKREQQAVGTDEVQSVALGLRPEGSEFRTTLHLATPNGRTRLLRLFDQPALQEEALRYVPADALVYGALSLDLAPTWTAFLALIEDSGKPEDRKNARALRACQSFLDTVLKAPTEAWLRAVGPQACFYLGGNLLPPTGCLILRKGKSYDTVEGAAPAFLAVLEGVDPRENQWKEISWSGRTLRYLVNKPMQPGYVVDGDWLLFGPVLELKAALSRAAKPAGTLAANPAFAKATAGISRDARAILYVNVPALAPFVPLAADPLRAIGIDPAALPEPATLASLLSPLAASVTVKPDSVSLEMRSPFPLILALAAKPRLKVERSDGGHGQGVCVSSMAAGSNAESAGIRVGDVIIRYDGHDANLMNLSDLVSASRPGSTVEIEVDRQGERKVLRAKGGRLGITTSAGLWMGLDNDNRREGK